MAGEATGRIQLIELNNKYVLRSYSEHQNRINSISFAKDNRTFVSCANETSIKLWDIRSTEKECQINVANAHADNVKRVNFVPQNEENNLVLSVGQDGFVKMWDLRTTQQPLSSLNVENPIEDFCFGPNREVMVGHSNSLQLLTFAEDSQLKTLETLYPF